MALFGARGWGAKDMVSQHLCGLGLDDSLEGNDVPLYIRGLVGQPKLVLQIKAPFLPRIVCQFTRCGTSA